MIENRRDLVFYLKADAIALGLDHLNPILTFNPIWKYQRVLRKVEYYQNTGIGNSLIGKVIYIPTLFVFKLLGTILGYSIAPNSFGPGLSIAHRGTIVVNGNARIGANCRIHVCVNIGASAGSDKAPRIGDNVYIAPGAKIYGDIDIADNVAIGANAVVNRSFTVSGVTIAGVPANVINEKGTEDYLKRADQIAKEE